MPDNYNNLKKASHERILTGRWIFAGEDVNLFRDYWLRQFAEVYASSRIEGYVLDLTKGRLWAALDLSEVSDEVYKDIILRVVEPDDSRAAYALITMCRDCNSSIRPNKLTYSFNVQKMPKLAEVCSILDPGFLGRSLK